MNRRLSLILVMAVLALFVVAATAATVRAGKTTTQCWFADGWLYATGLPMFKAGPQLNDYSVKAVCFA